MNTIELVPFVMTNLAGTEVITKVFKGDELYARLEDGKWEIIGDDGWWKECDPDTAEMLNGIVEEVML